MPHHPASHPHQAHQTAPPAAPPLAAAPPADAVVQARNLTKVYGTGPARVAALNNVSLTITRGQFAAVMGPSGLSLIHI